MKLFKKKQTEKRKRTPAEKESLFINISTKILLLITIIVAIALAGKSIADELKGSDFKALQELTKEVDTSLFIDNPIMDSDNTNIKQKITDSAWDIMEDGLASYGKFSNPTIAVTSGLSATPNELGSLYNEIYISYGDTFNTILKQITVTADSDGYNLKLVCTMDLSKMFPSKSMNMSSLPARVYIISNSKIKSGAITPLSTTINNLDQKLSAQLIDATNESNNMDFQKYVPSIFTDFIKALSQKTGLTLDVNSNRISFNQGM